MDSNIKVDYTKALIEKASLGKHTKFELLTNMQSLLAARKVLIATEAVIKAFRLTERKTFSDYLKNLKHGIDDVTLLINYRLFKSCKEFYETELTLVDKSITEFHNFMLTPGNLINTLLGFERPEDQMHEFLDIGVMSDINE